MTTTPEVLLVGALLLLLIGLYGFVTCRHLIKLLIALQIMLKAVLIALVGAGVSSGQPQLAQSLAVIVIGADTIVAVVGLALVVVIFQRFGTLDVDRIIQTRG